MQAFIPLLDTSANDLKQLTSFTFVFIVDTDSKPQTCTFNTSRPVHCQPHTYRAGLFGVPAAWLNSLKCSFRVSCYAQPAFIGPPSPIQGQQQQTTKQQACPQLLPTRAAAGMRDYLQI
jgi:hypothetical protein